MVDAIARCSPDEATAAVTRHIHEFYEHSGLSSPVDEAAREGRA